MADNFTSANVIEVFPLAKFRNQNATNRQFTETNVANLTSNITDKDSFVIDDDGTNISFILEGYYFKVKKDSPISLEGDVFVSLHKTGGYLDGDNSSTEKFEGLEVDYESGTLLLLTDGAVPDSSYQKISTKSIYKETNDVWILDGRS